MDIHINNLKKFAGEGMEIVENPKFIEKKEKEFFMSLMDVVSSLDDRSVSLLNLGIDLVNYEDPYYQLIEGLIVKHYGPTKGGVMLWWCGERKLLPTKKYNMIDEHGNQTLVSNLNQLYNFLKKLK
jgi:hypothetical protein